MSTSLIPVGLGLGQQWANNPGLSAPSGVQKVMSTLDPVGNAVTKIGGDPLNIYGNKDNPNALLFPTQAATSTANGLPAPSGPTMPIRYAADSFVSRPMNGGIFNDMAARLAGPVYSPQRVAAPVTSAASQPTTAVLGKGATPADANLMGLMLKMQQGRMQ